MTAKVAPLLRERLRAQGSLSLFEQVEMPLVPVLADIERNGFLLDVEGLRALSKELERELEQMVGTIYRLGGGEFNIGSPEPTGDGAVRHAGPEATPENEDWVFHR